MQMEASGEVVEVVTEEVTTSLVEPPEEVTTKAPVEKVTPELTKSLSKKSRLQLLLRK